MNPNDNDLLAELLIHWEALFEAGTDLSAIELAPDRPDLTAELQRHIAALKATAWLNQPVGRFQAEPTPAPTSLEKTTLIGRYRLDELVAEGGFAQVWRAFDLELHRSVAVNLPKPSRIDSTESFMAEARRVARLKHRHRHGTRCPHGKWKMFYCFGVRGKWKFKPLSGRQPDLD